MALSHVHKMLKEWFRVHPHLREELNAYTVLTFEFLYVRLNSLRELGGNPLYVKDTRTPVVATSRTKAAAS